MIILLSCIEVEVEVGKSDPDSACNINITTSWLHPAYLALSSSWPRDLDLHLHIYCEDEEQEHEPS